MKQTGSQQLDPQMSPISRQTNMCIVDCWRGVAKESSPEKETIALIHEGNSGVERSTKVGSRQEQRAFWVCEHM